MLFIDEIHRIARPAEELLYMAMEDFRVDVVVGKGPGATAIPLELAPFTLVGATTRAGLLTGPLRDRFGFTGHMDFYDTAELEQVLRRSAALLGVELRDDGAAEIAGRSRGTPRIANRLLRRVRDYAEVRADGVVTAARSPTPRWPSTTSTSSGSTGSTARCWTRSCAGSAGDRSASARSPSRSARRSRRSRRWPSRSWSGPVCSPAPRAGASRRRPPGRTSACSAPGATSRIGRGRRCSTSDRTRGHRSTHVRQVTQRLHSLAPPICMRSHCEKRTAPDLACRFAAGDVSVTRRNRERAAAQQTKMRERIGFGTDVMTTSGLYGTVVGVNPDDSVQLSIAPGVEVKWAIAALRDVESLPTQYRKGAEPDGDGGRRSQ